LVATLAVDMVNKKQYLGDPLDLRVTLTTPEVAGAAGVTSNSWATKVSFEISRVSADGSRAPVVVDTVWPQSLIPATDTSLSVRLGLPARGRIWALPPKPDLMPCGAYAVRAVLDGGGLIDDKYLDGSGKLVSREVSFNIVEAATAYEKATHQMRLSKYAYANGQYEDAVASGEAAIRAADAYFPELGTAYMVVAAGQYALKDYAASVRTYERLLTLIPARSDLADMVKSMRDHARSAQDKAEAAS
jgi:hypothetical protein